VSGGKKCEDIRTTTNSEEEKARRGAQRRPRQPKLGDVTSQNQSSCSQLLEKEATYSKKSTVSHFTTTDRTYFSYALHFTTRLTEVLHFTTGNYVRLSATARIKAPRSMHEAVRCQQ